MGDETVTEYTTNTDFVNYTDNTESTDSVYWIWFQTLFGIGTRRAELLMNYFHNPKAIFDGIAKKNRIMSMLTDDELKASEICMSKAKEIKLRTLAKGVDIITPNHTDYPELLKPIYSKPAVLYVKGDLKCLRGRLAIAMVGSRKHTEYGKDASVWIANGLSRGDAVVVSGLAHGIDTECHMAALMAGGKSIGVLGCGIDVDYPKGNAKVKRLICENGAVVTEYPLGVEPHARNFPVRNRLVSGMCHGVVVVEAEIKSGSLLTAQHALDQGRDIFAVPGSIFSRREQGTHRLIREGAKLCENAQDIFDEFEYLGLWKNVSVEYNPNLDAPTSYSCKSPMKDTARENLISTEISQNAVQKHIERRPLPVEISEEASSVYSVMGVDAITIDQIGEVTDMDISKILSSLTELEIYGLVQTFPGRKFSIIPV